MTSHKPIIALANYYQFFKGEKKQQSCVKSRLLLWVKSGEGEITVNRVRHTLSAGDIYWLPWNKSLTYQAALDNPFCVGAIHLIPHHDTNIEPQFSVAHTENDALSNAKWRTDKILEGLEGVLYKTYANDSALIYLAEHIVKSFRQNGPNENSCRTAAALLLNELNIFFNNRDDNNKTYSEKSTTLEPIIKFIENHINEPLSLKRLVRFSGKSSATLCRLFKAEFSTSPVNVILDMKINMAKQLLTNQRLSVAEIGIKIGIDDPYYFSKLFKKRTGKSPREYRNTLTKI
ncbi:MAG: AraC family transcriptional regulator [Fibrobacteres bacterium]|nr:AraC family transcriptional regulator [Fibrobacterota bacterium]